MKNTGFYEYRENLKPAETYTRNGLTTSNSGKIIVCRLCGEEKSAVGSRAGVCKPCHNERWRRNKGFPSARNDQFGNTPRWGNVQSQFHSKKCLSCGCEKLSEEFRLVVRFDCGFSIYASSCIECRILKKTLPIRRGDKLRIEEFFKNTCQVCLKRVSGKNSHIDHCHKSGDIRGLLCSKCNLALGLLGDSSETIRRLFVYVTE